MTQKFGSSVIVIYSGLLVLHRPNPNLCSILQLLGASVWQDLDVLTVCVYSTDLSHVLWGDHHYTDFQTLPLYGSPQRFQQFLSSYTPSDQWDLCVRPEPSSLSCN